MTFLLKPLAVLTILFYMQDMNAQTYTATILTNYGDIGIMLYDSTPKHRDNFVKLILENFYDSILFHRVINGFKKQNFGHSAFHC